MPENNNGAAFARSHTVGKYIEISKTLTPVRITCKLPHHHAFLKGGA
jgi:hypothetical protein